MHGICLVISKVAVGVVFINVVIVKNLKEANKNPSHNTESNHTFHSIESLRILTNKYQLELEQHNTVMI